MGASKNGRALALTLVLAVLLGGACSGLGSGDRRRSVGNIEAVVGSVGLVRDGQAIEAAPGTDLLGGDRLTVEAPSSVDFIVDEAGEYRLVAGRVRVGEEGELEVADGTLQISSDQPVEADLDGVEVSFSEGTVRLDRSGDSSRLAAYEVQNLEVATGSHRIPLPQLWQVSISGDGTPDMAQPLQFSRDDALDSANLAHAIEVDGKLMNLLRGLEPQLAATDGSALAGHLAAAGISPETVERISIASRSDQLMGLAFAREWKKDQPTGLVTGFEQATALRVLGATWGLVAQNFGVDADGLVAGLQSEINAVFFPDGRSEGDPLVPSPPPSRQPPPAPGPPAQPTTPPAPGPIPAPPPAPVPVPVPSPSPSGLLGPVLDPLRPLLPGELEAIIDELYGLVHGILPIL